MSGDTDSDSYKHLTLQYATKEGCVIVAYSECFRVLQVFTILFHHVGLFSLTQIKRNYEH